MEQQGSAAAGDPGDNELPVDSASQGELLADSKTVGTPRASRTCEPPCRTRGVTGNRSCGAERAGDDLAATSDVDRVATDAYAADIAGWRRAIGDGDGSAERR